MISAPRPCYVRAPLASLPLVRTPPASAAGAARWTGQPELAWTALVTLLGLLPRLLFAALYPVLPVSDFRGVVDFALWMRDRSPIAPGYFWDVFNVGPPLVLSLLLRMFPGSPETTARVATAVATGLVPLVVFLLWRRVVPLWVRLLAATLLALWPGQVIFSGVVAQDNWVMPPTVALAALAVRSLLLGRGYPLAAGLLFALAVAMRQEMLVVLILPLVAAAGLASAAGRAWPSFAKVALAVAIPFLAMAAQRQAATGHFALSSGHVGVTLLGTVAPGATRLGWIDPISYMAAVAPESVGDRQRLFAASLPVALAEVRRRPVFQLARATAALLATASTSDAANLYWSLGAEGAQAASRQATARALSGRVDGFLVAEQSLIHALFLAALGLAVWRRNTPILVVASAVLIKLGIHAVLVSVGRFLVPATALELVAIALGCWQMVRLRAWRAGGVAMVVGLACAAGMLVGGKRLTAMVQARDPEIQRTYHFALTGWDHRGVLECVMGRGRLVALDASTAVVAPFGVPPAPGETAEASCVVRDTGAAAEKLALALAAPDWAPPVGAVPSVEVGGRELLSGHLPALGGGAVEAPLGAIGPTTRLPLHVTVVAGQQTPADGANVTLRLVRGGGAPQ